MKLKKFIKNLILWCIIVTVVFVLDIKKAMDDKKILKMVLYFLLIVLIVLFGFSLFGCTEEAVYPCECDDVVYTKWDNTEVNRFPIRYNELLCDQDGDTIVNNLKYYTIRECSYD